MDNNINQQNALNNLEHNNSSNETPKDPLATQFQKAVSRPDVPIQPLMDPSIKRIYTLKELADMRIESIPYIWEGIFPQQGIALITGPSDSNKSTFLRQFAYGIINRDELFLGRKLMIRHGKVLIISTEDDYISIAATIRKQKAHEFTSETQGSLSYYFHTVRNPNELRLILKDIKVDLVVLDTWTDNFVGDLNSTVSVRDNLQKFKKVADEHGCLILGVHHTKKGSEKQVANKGQMLGSQGLEALPRVVIDIRRGEGLFRELTIIKGNHIPDEFKNKSLSLKLNQETILLELTEEAGTFGFQNVREYAENASEQYKEDIEQWLIEGVSQDKMVQILKSKYFGQRTPSKGTINKWIQEMKNNGQSSDSLAV